MMQDADDFIARPTEAQGYRVAAEAMLAGALPSSSWSQALSNSSLRRLKSFDSVYTKSTPYIFRLTFELRVE